MRSLPLPFTFGEVFLSCGRGSGLTLGRGELSIILGNIRVFLGGVIMGGEELIPAKSTPPPPEPSKPFLKVLFLGATGVLVRQSSGMRYANSSMPTTWRFGAV